jgi:hypothetical protein
MSYCNRSQIARLYKLFFQDELSVQTLEKFPDYVLTPATVFNCFRHNILDTQIAIQELLETELPKALESENEMEPSSTAIHWKLSDEHPKDEPKSPQVTGDLYFGTVLAEEIRARPIWAVQTPPPFYRDTTNVNVPLIVHSKSTASDDGMPNLELNANIRMAEVD